MATNPITVFHLELNQDTARLEGDIEVRGKAHKVRYHFCCLSSVAEF